MHKFSQKYHIFLPCLFTSTFYLFYLRIFFYRILVVFSSDNREESDKTDKIE